MMARLLVLSGLSAWALSGCASYPPPMVDGVLMAQTRESKGLIERGYEVHLAKCGKCHPYEDPRSYSAAEWRSDIMPEMAGKSKLAAADEKAVLAYLLAARGLPAQAR